MAYIYEVMTISMAYGDYDDSSNDFMFNGCWNMYDYVNILFDDQYKDIC